MHDIEPHYHWRDHYIASEDAQSPFFGRQYNEFQFTQKVYNYFIHPQWDSFGSTTLYTKLLFADYDEGFAILEMIGEWNDTLHNDVEPLKREVVDLLLKEGISKYLVICENVLNFHGSDDCYYEEWYDDVLEQDGWITFLNLLPHVEEEMVATQIHHFVHFGKAFNDVNWRPQKPKLLVKAIEAMIHGQTRALH